MTESKKPKPSPKKPRLIAVVGIDYRGKRSEPGDPVDLPKAVTEDYLRRGKIRKA